jgi:pimeloyl-ACP methyl ester carboxylesterase
LLVSHDDLGDSMGVVVDRLVDRRLARAAGSLWTRVDGRRFHARHVGPEVATASPVVCVHGVGVSSRYMVATMAELASTFDVYAIDLPGFGLTDRPPEVLDVVGLADALAGWIQAAGVGRPALLANSVGCQIAVDCALRYPDRVSRMVLVGPTIDPIARWTCPGFPDVSYLLGSLLPAAMVSFASYSSGLR